MNSKNLIIVLAAILTIAVNVNASYNFSLGNSGWVAVTDDPSVDIVVNDVDFDQDQVVIGITKSFDNPYDEYGFFDPIVIEFEKTVEYAISVIAIEDEFVFNNTGVEWLDYHMFLMVDMFTPEAGFSKLSMPDGGQFESVSYSDYGSGVYNLPIQIDFLDLDGSGVASSPSLDNAFTPGLIDGQIRIQTNESEMAIGDRFGFKQVPSIPEPATMFFLGLGVSFAVKLSRKNGRA